MLRGRKLPPKSEPGIFAKSLVPGTDFGCAAQLVPYLLVQHRNRFGDQGGFVMAFDFDADFGDDLIAAALVHLDGFQSQVAAHAGARGDHVEEAEFVAAIVDAVHGTFQLIEFVVHHGQQGECQKAVGDGAFGRQFFCGAFHVHMNPLMVAGGLGEFIDAVLVDGDPFTGAHCCAHGFFHFCDVGEIIDCHFGAPQIYYDW